MNKFLLKSSLIIIILSLINSCKTPQPCPDEPAPGNIGAPVNTGSDELAPSFSGKKLYLTDIDPEEPDESTLLNTELIDASFAVPKADTALPLRAIQGAGLPVFYQNEIFFAAENRQAENPNSDIFHSKKIDGTWTAPEPLKNLNSSVYDSHPAVSPDGNYLVFASDREGSLGDIDLYISRRNDDGSWSEAVNLGENINTENTEIAPHIDALNNLYFSSKGYSQRNDHDILKAPPSSDFRWKQAKPLRTPINTEYNELGAFVVQNQIMFASDRIGGCGGYDLYSFDLCGPVRLEGNVVRKSGDMPIEGYIELYDSFGYLTATRDIDESGAFSFSLKPLEKYTVQYHNDCFSNFQPEKNVVVPCSDSSSVKIAFNFVIPDMTTEFDFAEYDVPFFVTGYYYPNTSENLEALRLKFSYNLISDDPKTRYIEDPGNKYDKYTEVVERALLDAKNFIAEILNSMNNECARNNLDKLSITVVGYSDPRVITEQAKYADDSINDLKFGISLQEGADMNNQRLSMLRAYYTAKFIESELKSNPNYRKLQNKIDWNIKGLGIDKSQKENLLKRRVKITVKVN